MSTGNSWTFSTGIVKPAAAQTLINDDKDMPDFTKAALTDLVSQAEKAKDANIEITAAYATLTPPPNRQQTTIVFTQYNR